MKDENLNLIEINKRLSTSKRVSWCPENARQISRFYQDFNKRNRYLTKYSNIYIQLFNLFSNRFTEQYGWDALSMILEPVATKGQYSDTGDIDSHKSSWNADRINISTERKPISIFSYLICDASRNSEEKAGMMHPHALESIRLNRIERSSEQHLIPVMMNRMNNSSRAEMSHYFINNEKLISKVMIKITTEKVMGKINEFNASNNSSVSKKIIDYSKGTLAVSSMNPEKVMEKINEFNASNNSSVSKEFNDVRMALESVDTSGFDSDKLHDYSKLTLTADSMDPEKVMKKINELIKNAKGEVKKELVQDVENIKTKTSDSISGVHNLSKVVPEIRRDLKEELLKSIAKLKQNEMERKGYY